MATGKLVLAIQVGIVLAIIGTDKVSVGTTIVEAATNNLLNLTLM